jgi:hypothetical protein
MFMLAAARDAWPLTMLVSGAPPLMAKQTDA